MAARRSKIFAEFRPGFNLLTGQPGYTGTSYLQVVPDVDTLVQTNEITASPVVSYPINFTTAQTYTVWLRGYPTNAAGDSVVVGLGDERIEATGFAPGAWSWANTTPGGLTARLSITTTGVQTMTLAMREDGLRIDRLLLTTDTNYIPADFGPVESERQLGSGSFMTPLTRTIVYTYDNLYRLTEADYTTGESYAYNYDPVGNRGSSRISVRAPRYSGDSTEQLGEKGIALKIKEKTLEKMIEIKQSIATTFEDFELVVKSFHKAAAISV